MPSVHEAAMYEPLGWKETCFTGFGCSRRKSTLVMSPVSTILTSVSLSYHQHETLLASFSLLACYCSPVPVRRYRQITDWYGTSSKKLVEGACIKRIHADGAIFGSHNTKVVLL